MLKSELIAENKKLKKQVDAHWELWKLAEDLLEMKDDWLDLMGKIEVLVGGYFNDKLK